MTTTRPGRRVRLGAPSAPELAPPDVPGATLTYDHLLGRLARLDPAAEGEVGAVHAHFLELLPTPSAHEVWLDTPAPAVRRERLAAVGELEHQAACLARGLRTGPGRRRAQRVVAPGELAAAYGDVVGCDPRAAARFAERALAACRGGAPGLTWSAEGLRVEPAPISALLAAYLERPAALEAGAPAPLFRGGGVLSGFALHGALAHLARAHAVDPLTGAYRGALHTALHTRVVREQIARSLGHAGRAARRADGGRGRARRVWKHDDGRLLYDEAFDRLLAELRAPRARRPHLEELRRRVAAPFAAGDGRLVRVARGALSEVVDLLRRPGEGHTRPAHAKPVPLPEWDRAAPGAAGARRGAGPILRSPAQAAAALEGELLDVDACGARQLREHLERTCGADADADAKVERGVALLQATRFAFAQALWELRERRPDRFFSVVLEVASLLGRHHIACPEAGPDPGAACPRCGRSHAQARGLSSAALRSIGARSARSGEAPGKRSKGMSGWLRELLPPELAAYAKLGQVYSILRLGSAVRPEELDLVFELDLQPSPGWLAAGRTADDLRAALRDELTTLYLGAEAEGDLRRTSPTGAWADHLVEAAARTLHTTARGFVEELLFPFLEAVVGARRLTAAERTTARPDLGLAEAIVLLFLGRPDPRALAGALGRGAAADPGHRGRLAGEAGLSLLTLLELELGRRFATDGEARALAAALGADGAALVAGLRPASALTAALPPELAGALA